MSRMMSVTDELMVYIDKVGVREHPALARCREETAELPMALMQIGADQGAIMSLLAKIMGATRYLEVGTFTGYSALAVALALPSNGRSAKTSTTEYSSVRTMPPSYVRHSLAHTSHSPGYG